MMIWMLQNGGLASFKTQSRRRLKRRHFRNLTLLLVRDETGYLLKILWFQVIFEFKETPLSARSILFYSILFYSLNVCRKLFFWIISLHFRHSMRDFYGGRLKKRQTNTNERTKQNKHFAGLG